MDACSAKEAIKSSLDSVSICYVDWGPSNRIKSLGEIVRIASLRKLHIREIVIVDNKGECSLEGLPRGIPALVLAGSNNIR